MRWAALRYFNVAGAGAPELGDRSVNNLVPMAFQALTDGRNPQLFGDDYPTRDGSCIRDYIHVVDLAEAHAAAARRLDEEPMGEVFNVGRGEGITVKEVLETVREVTGVDFEVEVVGRRAGDAPVYFADATKIGKQLGWTARLDLADMVRSGLGRLAEEPLTDVRRVSRPGSRAAGRPRPPRCGPLHRAWPGCSTRAR